jgi:hypothetical protein
VTYVRAYDPEDDDDGRSQSKGALEAHSHDGRVSR